MKTVYVFRHGETDWNREWRFQGHTDIPLNEVGIRQAGALAEFFKNKPIEVFLSSDLGRAFMTAKISSGTRNIPIVTDPRLRETKLGLTEGMTRSEIEAKFGRELWDEWQKVGPDMWQSRLPGGESKGEHRDRVLLGITDFLSKSDATVVGVATHGGVIRRLVHHFAPELTEPAMIGNCAVYEFKYSKESGLALPRHAPLWTCSLPLT